MVKHYEQNYKEGKPVSKIKKIKNSKETGTEITFVPSKEIFSDTNFDAEK